ncbi:nodulin-26 family protein [Hibiscus syriacus]|uniref:Very-long-chain (3R)-3-hydroxyacyl-CoA dehydratase n=1 Tax=Hibiscus syriacus TaxID=106335 RepID=A0A6A2YVJ5_HIBSY|nr:nodulin-26 family protein [Hibiscus syriacus]
MAQLLKLYLFAYNSLQAFGWTISLFRILTSFIATNSVNGAYASAGDLICLLQTCAFLEVVHGAIGIVPSGVLFPLMQWSGRTHFLLAIVCRIPEVIRYSHYALNIFGGCPSWLTYLRYTTFIVLYPMGLAPGEMWLMYQALQFIKEKNLYGISLLIFPLAIMILSRYERSFTSANMRSLVFLQIHICNR